MTTFERSFRALLFACDRACKANCENTRVHHSLKKYAKGFNQTIKVGEENHKKFVRTCLESCRNYLSCETDVLITTLIEADVSITVSEKSETRICISRILKKCQDSIDHENMNRVAYRFLVLLSCVMDPEESEEMITYHHKKFRETIGYEEDSPNPGVTPILNMATELSKSLGVEMPEGINLNDNNMQNIIGQLATDPSMQEVIGETLSGLNLKDPADMPTAIGRLMEQMQKNPKMKEIERQMEEAVKKSHEDGGSSS